MAKYESGNIGVTVSLILSNWIDFLPDINYHFTLQKNERESFR